MQHSVFETITDQIIAAIEAGADDFVMPWHKAHSELSLPVNAGSGRGYRGSNILALWLSAKRAGYSTAQWATYRQWRSLDAQVRKGEKGTTVLFWERREQETDDPASSAATRYVAKSFIVFNAAQVDGFVVPDVPQLSEGERIAEVERFFAAIGATIGHGGDRAYFSPVSDAINMPEFSQFHSAEAYYSVLAHELIHWSGARQRLGREGIGVSDPRKYAFEELVAELGAAFLCARLGIATEPRTDHAPYVACWLETLGADTRALFKAASLAQVAVDFLDDLARPPSAE